ncbi:hypothetical protein [Streptomyces sp. NPDC088748]|uniref:hypothetical protein n=1 Tax=Streptomyces sp. NPDC088748 TaxID=3365887 RepID=UPI00380B3ACD
MLFHRMEREPMSRDVHLCTVRYIGRLLPDVPRVEVEYMATQLNGEDVSRVKRYTKRKPLATLNIITNDTEPNG